MSRSAQCPNFAKARFSDIRSRSPRLPPTTAALTGLTPCARGGSKILPSPGIRRAASEYRIGTRGSSVRLFTRSFLKRSSIARGPAWRTGMPDKQPLRNMPQNGIFCLRYWGSLGRPTTDWRTQAAGETAASRGVLPYRYGNRGRSRVQSVLLGFVEGGPVSYRGVEESFESGYSGVYAGPPCEHTSYVANGWA
jgi:hypothetical protein